MKLPESILTVYPSAGYVQIYNEKRNWLFPLNKENLNDFKNRGETHVTLRIELPNRFVFSSFSIAELQLNKT